MNTRLQLRHLARESLLGRYLTRMILAIMLLSLYPADIAKALDLDPEQIKGSKSNLPETVLENRYFLKAWRPEFGLFAGSIWNEAYLKSSTLGLRSSFFFNEWMGVEYRYTKTTVEKSADLKALNQRTYRDVNDPSILKKVEPDINPVHNIHDVHFIYAPLYGKLNLLDKKILYYDMYASTGYSLLDTDQGKKSGFSLALGQRFFFTRSASFLVEFHDRFFKELRGGEENTRQLTTIDLGFSFFTF